MLPFFFENGHRTKCCSFTTNSLSLEMVLCWLHLPHFYRKLIARQMSFFHDKSCDRFNIVNSLHYTENVVKKLKVFSKTDRERTRHILLFHYKWCTISKNRILKSIGANFTDVAVEPSKNRTPSGSRYDLKCYMHCVTPPQNFVLPLKLAPRPGVVTTGLRLRRVRNQHIYYKNNYYVT